MPHLSAFALQLIDPRGRCNRRGLLLAAALLLGLQVSTGAALLAVGLGLTGRIALTLNLVFCWVGFAVVSKRLHDLGRSTWWVPTAVLIWLAGAISVIVAIVLIGDPEYLTPGTPGYWLVFGLMMVPLFITAVWLHVAEGDAVENRFGPAPTALGFSMPPDTGLWRPTFAAGSGAA